MNKDLIFKNAIGAALIYIILKVVTLAIGIEMQYPIDWVIFAIIVGLFIFLENYIVNLLMMKAIWVIYCCMALLLH